MLAPVKISDFVGVVKRSGLIAEDAWAGFLRDNPELPEQPAKLAQQMIDLGLVTRFQAKHMLAGRHRGLVLGPYKLIDQIGKGGSGVVFLAEHRKLKRQVAIKILPTEGLNQETLERFYREARAVASLDHPNIIRAHDVNNE